MSQARRWPGVASSRARTAVLLAATALSASAFADYKLPESSVDNYRLESHYGAETPVLNMLYPRNNSLELTVGGAYSPFSSTATYAAGTASVTFNFNQRHAIEPVWLAYGFPKLTDFVQNELVAKNGLNPATVAVEVPKFIYAASYLFSPYYSKMHITEQSVAHFDVYFGVGFGLLKSQDLYSSGTKSGSYSRPALSMAAGMRFLLNGWWSARIELRDFVHASQAFNKVTTGNTLQMGLSTGVMF